MKRALALCPAAVVVPARPDRYAECSGRLRVVLETFTPAVDPDSHHGFYLNFFGSPHLQDDSLGTLRRLQLEILKLTGLSVSIGAAKSKVAAAVASRLERPGGVRIIASGAEAAFLASLSVEALDGLHSIDAKNLRSRGISTVAELRRVPLPALEIAFGQSVGRQIWHHARGLDVRPAAAWPTGPLLSPWPALAWLPSPFRKFASSFLGAKALPTCFSFAVGMRHLKSSRRFMFASHSG